MKKSKLSLIACNVLGSDYIALSAKEGGGKVTTDEWQQIAKVGKWKGHIKGAFEIKPEDLKTIVKNFENSPLEEVVADYEHQTLYNDVAPASGWIKELKIKGKSLLARIEWTLKATDHIKAKEYKYLSPVLAQHYINQKTGEDQGWTLHSVALTNKPFFEELDELKLNKNQSNNKEDKVDIDEIKEELKKVKKERDDLLQELKDLKKANAEQKVDAAIAAKKIQEDQRESMLAFSQSDPEQFDEFIKNAKVVGVKPAGDDMFDAKDGQGEGKNIDVLKLGGFKDV